MSSFIREEFGGVVVYIATSAQEGSSEIVVIEEESDGLVGTSSKKAVRSLKSVIKGIAIGLTEELKKAEHDLAPDETRLTMSVKFSEKLDAWLVGAIGEQAVGLEFVWKRTSQ